MLIRSFLPKYLLKLAFGWIFVLLAMISVPASSAQVNPHIEFASLVIEKAKIDQQEIHYAFAGDVTKPGVLFVHGTPGGWHAFERYLNNPDLQKLFFMVSIDRLGWGKSALSDGGIAADFMLQASAISTVMQHYQNKQWTIVGHSLGASIAPQVALQSPEISHALILLAGSLDPKMGKPRWYNWFANTWLTSKLVGQQMRNSNREIMQLSSELEKMNLRLNMQVLATKLVVIQGSKDKLVSPKNVAFVKREWPDRFQSLEVIELAEEGHFLPWRQTPLVIETIKRLNRH